MGLDILGEFRYMKAKEWDIPGKFRYFKEINLLDILGKLPNLRKRNGIDALCENHSTKKL